MQLRVDVAGEGAPVSLSGNLGSFALDEVLELLGHTTKTGALHVRDGDTSGVVYMTDGRICAVELGDATGPAAGRDGLERRVVDAVLTLGELPGGTFEFEPGRTPTFSTNDVLEVGPVLERTRVLRARWHAIARLVPSLDEPVALAAELTHDTVTLDRATWAVIASVDGRRSVRAIAAAIDDSVFEVAAALAPLVEAGAVAVGTDRVGPPGVEGGLFRLGTFAAALDGVERAKLTAPAVAPVEAKVVEEPGDPSTPLTEGPEALARLNRAELERAALGEPVEPEPVPVGPVDAGEAVDAFEPVEPVEQPEERLARPPTSDDEDESHPAAVRDRGSLLRMFSTLRDG